MHVTNRLTRASPSGLATPAGEVALRIADAGGTLSPGSFEVTVGSEAVSIPERLYVDDVATMDGQEKDLAACLLSRHHDGHVRARALERVLELNTPWSTPFIVRLMGEYVIEILEQIDASFARLDPSLLKAFVDQNPTFVRLTRARITSYWNCYYRNAPSSEYVGFRLIRRLEEMGSAHTSP